MPLSTTDQATQTVHESMILEHSIQCSFEKFNDLDLLKDYEGDPAVAKIKRHFPYCRVRFLSTPSIAYEIEQLFLKQNKTPEDFCALLAVFSYFDGKHFGLINNLHQNSSKQTQRLSDKAYYSYLTNNQMILLLLLVELQKMGEDTPELSRISKESLVDECMRSYGQGIAFLDKARQFWRDDHPLSPFPYSIRVGSFDRFLSYQERYRPHLRQSDLTHLYILLHEKERCVIHGLKGAGKTRLAQAYANQANKNQAYNLMVWIDAETQDGIKEVYLNTLNVIDNKRERTCTFYKRFVYHETTRLEDIKNTLNEYLVDKANEISSSLFIFDNAASYEAVQPFLPNHGHIIITTQTHPEKDMPSLELSSFVQQEVAQ